MNPVIESTFHTEPDLYCGADTDCNDHRTLYRIVLTEAELLSIMQDHAQRSRHIREGMIAAIQELNAEAAKVWIAHISPAVNKPGTVPVGLAVSDAKEFYQAARAVYTPPPVHLRLTPADAHIIRRIWQRLGGFLTTATFITNRKGNIEVVLSGYAGLRRTLDNTRYLRDNPRILQLGIGMQGIKHVARSSAVLAVIVSSAVEVGEWHFNDNATLRDLAGGVGVELVKTGISIAVGMLGAAALGAITTIAIAPMFGFVVASLIAGYVLNEGDSHFGIKKKIKDTLNDMPTNTAGLEAGWYRLHDGSLERLQQIRSGYEAEIRRLQNQAIQQAGNAATRAGAAALEHALNQAQRKVASELQLLLGRRLR